MPGQALHQLDAFLCRHARDNIWWNLDHPDITRRVDRLDQRLAVFVQTGHPSLSDIPAVGVYLLSDQEFDALIEAVSGLPAALVDPSTDQPDRQWLSDASFFRDTPLCTAEVRQHLAPAEAERWAENCNALVKRLTSGRLLLAQGLETARQLASLIRQYLVAMGEHTLVPPPLGSFPTPTNPEPRAVDVATKGPRRKRGKQSPLERMRRVVQEHPNGRTAKADALIRIAKIRKADGLAALAELKTLGEYDGLV